MDEIRVIASGSGPWTVRAQKRVRYDDGAEETIYLDGKGKDYPEAKRRCDRLVLQFLSDPGHFL